MSHIHDGPLATYNALADPNLAGYFGNTRMRRQLRRSGLINRRGEIISENQYRINMARKEHKKHVKDLLAQAIVHKTLDLERYRQVEIKKKLEEIAKIELVRRVRATRGRRGDEEVLPYLSPRSHSRPQSGRISESSSGKRPKSAPSRQPRHRVHPSNGYADPYHDVIYVDDDGRPVSPPPSERQHLMKTEEIDSRHLYALDSEALQKYALKLSKMERGRDGATSPYVISQFPTPPRRPRSQKSSPGRSARMSQSPVYREKKSGSVRDGHLVRSDKDPDTVEGGLMLHRQEPAMMHQGEVQTLCEITMKYHGPNLTLPRDQRDPTQEVSIDQQHCGGNTLPVFRERLTPGSTFSFISRRHRGYPFSLTMYIDGRVDCRVSTCCEYKHAVGVKLGGKMGHFSLMEITGATPCYKCKLSVQAPPRILKLKKSGSRDRKKRPEQLREEVTAGGTPRTAVGKEKDDKKEVSGEEDAEYESDFTSEDEKSKGKKSDDYADDFEPEESETPKSDRREIIGLKVDETREDGRTVSVDVKEKEEEERKQEDDAVMPYNRRIESYSSEDEDTEGGRKQQVKVDVHEDKKKGKSSRERRTSSSSSSSASSREPSPREIRHEVKKREVTVSPVKKVEKTEEEPAHVSVTSARSEESSLPKTDRSTTSSNSLTTETGSMVEPKQDKKTELTVAKPGKIERQRSVSSSSSSSSSSDSEDERLKRKREKQRKEEAEKKKQEDAEREMERKRKAEEDEQRRKKEDEDRRKRFELERQQSQERMKLFEIERKKREIEMEEKKKEEERVKEEERQKRLLEEQRMKEKHEMDLKRLQEQRENEQRAARMEEEKTEKEKNVEVEKQYDRFADMRFRQVRTEMKPISEMKSEQTPKKKVRESSSSSSSSSDSESESEGKRKEKKAPSPPPQPKKIIPPQSPPKAVEKKPVPSESSSSTTTSSETSSGSESERDKVKTPVAAMATINEEKVEKKETEVKSAVRKSSSSSSSSGSESDSESDDKKKSAQPPARVPSPEVKQSTQEVPSPEKKTPQRRSSSSSTTSSGSSDSESEPTPPKSEKKETPAPFGALQHERPLEDKDVKAEPEKQPVKKTVSSSEDSSSDSSSSGSDSESDSEPKKKQTKQAPKSTSESEGETMHGGADPEKVAEGAPKGSILAQSTVTPAEPQEGSIMGMIQGQSDIDLNGVLLNEDQIAQLSSYIVEAVDVKTLSLRNTGLTDHSFGRLALAIQLSEDKLKILNLGQNELGPASMQPLTAALTKTPSMEVLILNGNPIGDEGVKKLVSSMVSSKEPFPFLRRSSGYMTPSETRAVNPDKSSRPVSSDTAKLTPGACKLTELGLAETNVTDAGMVDISRLLETSTTLTSLNLNGNKNITKEGWTRLSQALAKNTILKNLSLDFCQLGDDGIAILSRGLRINTALRSLELECAGLTEKGGLLLRDLLRENTSILQVTAMPGNSISDGMMAEIRKYLALNNAGYSSS